MSLGVPAGVGIAKGMGVQSVTRIILSRHLPCGPARKPYDYQHALSGEQMASYSLLGCEPSGAWLLQWDAACHTGRGIS